MTIIRTDRRSFFDVERVQLPEGQPVESHRGRADRSLAVHGAVEDRGLIRRTVETEVRNRQVGLPIRAREGHRAVNERALGRLLRCERGELRRRVHADGHGRTRRRGHGDRVCREGQVDPLAGPVRRVLRIEQTGHVFRERLSAQRVCVGSVGQISQLHLEGPPAGALAQLSLRSRRVRGTHNARIDGRGRGCLRVHHASADPARGPEGAIRCRRIDDRVRSPH